MKKPKISIIVPVYNAEKYIDRCVASVIGQTFSDWELILIDDGSKDGSLKACQVHSGCENRIITIHQKNGGANNARLTGLKVSKGDYITFLDADDTLPADALELMNAEASKGFDIIKGTLDNFDVEGIYYQTEHYPITDASFENNEEYMEAYYTNKVAPYMCGGLYKREIVTEHEYKLTVDNNITIGEDWIVGLYVSKRAGSVRIIPNVVYHYFHNTGATMNTSVMGREQARRIDGCVEPLINICSPIIHSFYNEKQIQGALMREFQPELGFSLADYKEIVKYIGIHPEFRSSVEKKYLRAIRFMPLFFFYTRLYGLMYRIVKLKGKSRQIK